MSMDTQVSKKKKNKPLLFALIGIGALTASVGGVFAANSIQINGGAAIELGQGLASVDSCEDAITTSITQTYDVTDDAFYASTIVVSGIKDFACDGKNINVTLIGEPTVGTAEVVCGVDGTATSGANQDSFLIADAGTTGTDDDVTKTVTIEADCDATEITKVAITTS